MIDQSSTEIDVVWGTPSSDRASAPDLARMSFWVNRSTPADPVGMTLIEGARVYPGNVQSRGKTSHTGGQLVLDADFKPTAASWCFMDGRKTLPTDVDIFAPFDTLGGDHYFLGSVHPHSGHALLEGLARTWALDDFLRQHPDGRIIIHEPWTPTFAIELLELAGVDEQRLLRPAGPIQVERLHVPGISAFSHRWTAPEQVRTWRRIGDAPDDGRDAEPRVYLSRRGIGSRSLTNEAEVEDRFAEAGFTIVRPETLSMQKQIRLARGAQVLAGCVGSQMYLAAFQPVGAATPVMAPSNFFLPDDSPIARAMDHRLAVAFGGPSAYQMPQGPWSIDPAAASALIARSEDRTARRPRPSPVAAALHTKRKS